MPAETTQDHSDASPPEPGSSGSWTFLSNHAHVVVCIARDPTIRLRDIADAVGITERAAQRIVSELVDAGYLERRRSGRRNQYRVRLDLPLRHPLEADCRLGEVLVGVLQPAE